MIEMQDMAPAYKPWRVDDLVAIAGKGDLGELHCTLFDVDVETASISRITARSNRQFVHDAVEFDTDRGDRVRGHEVPERPRGPLRNGHLPLKAAARPQRGRGGAALNDAGARLASGDIKAAEDLRGRSSAESSPPDR
ncbi:hypothetical protein GCM10010191_68970 [Actinomadura vinacea]|uniref:Uncharacterized protein n=1 Tax=Actinomadura vinacea TaxID=115336 RepID=A0ABN3K0C3_9ACTN